jgi:hypothetical protein
MILTALVVFIVAWEATMIVGILSLFKVTP